MTNETQNDTTDAQGATNHVGCVCGCEGATNDTSDVTSDVPKGATDVQTDTTDDGATYWESSDYADDLAALDAKSDNQHLVAPHVREAAKMLLCLIEETPYEIPTYRRVSEFEIRTPETILGCLGDSMIDQPAESYKATKAALRLLQAELDTLNVMICKQVLIEEKWVRTKLQRIEDAGILAECEAIAAEYLTEADIPS